MSSRFSLSLMAIVCIVLASEPMAGDRPIPAGVEPAKRETQTAGKVSHSTGPVFTENRGQWADSIRFQVVAAGTVYWIVNDGLWVQLNSRQSETTARHRTVSPPGLAALDVERGSRESQPEVALVKIQFQNSSPLRKLAGRDRLSSVSNFFLGQDASRWRTHVPHYSEVEWNEIQPGTALRLSAQSGHLSFSILASPAALHAPIRVRLATQSGTIAALEGILSVQSHRGAFQGYLPAGVEFEQVQGATYELNASTLREASGAEASTAGLFYSTYLGGGLLDACFDIQVDGAGRAVVGGYTTSSDFPELNSFQGYQGDFDVFVTKLTAMGDGLEFSTFIGGALDDLADVFVLDNADDIFVGGGTFSNDFPVQDPVLSSTPDAGFVLKLAETGDVLEFSTYLGGGAAEIVEGISLDFAQNLYVAGWTFSADFPAIGSFQPYAGSGDAFVMKIEMSGPSIVYSSLLGGTESDYAFDLAVDSAGNAYVTGFTRSSNYPLAGPLQTFQSDADGFVTKLHASGDSLVYSTYLGGSGDGDGGFAIALGVDGSAYVTGSTNSSNFPTKNPVEPFQGDADAFLTRIGPDGDTLIYSTFLGGVQGDDGRDIVVEADGTSLLTGVTASPDFPVIFGFQGYQGAGEGYVLRMSPGGSVVWASFLGGSVNDYCEAIASDGAGGAFVAGWTQSTDFPQLGPYQSDQGGDDGFVTRICTDADLDCVADALDNCPVTYNPLQEDDDFNGVGDACDANNALVFSAFSPIDMVITDPAGDSIGIDSLSRVVFNTIQLGSSYDTLTDVNSADLSGPDGDLDDIVSIPNPMVGEYSVRLVREPGSNDGDKFTHTIRIDGNQQLIPDEYNNATLSSLGSPEVPSVYVYVTAFTLPGDVNASGQITSSDIIYMVNFIFKSGDPPVVEGHGDVNCNVHVTSADIIYLVNYVFKSGPPPCSHSAG